MQRDAPSSSLGHHDNQRSSRSDDSVTSNHPRRPVKYSRNRHEPREGRTWIAEARIRPVFAYETGPFPHEIERGCCFHFASYLCFGIRDPNIPPGENAVRLKPRLLEALKRLLVRLHLRKPPPAPTNAPPSTSVLLTSSSHGVHDVASNPASLSPTHQPPPAITTSPPTGPIGAQVDPPTFPAPSSEIHSPPAQPPLSPAAVDLTIALHGVQSVTESDHSSEPSKGKGKDPGPSVLLLGGSDVNSSSSVSKPRMSLELLTGDTAWNLDDIRSSFAHDLTGVIVREVEDPIASSSYGDIYRGTFPVRGRLP
ncbi:hypothetical protein BS17DRAFT_425906 [Gyrodon lividus]|nr:hypothetical protein BS17DRAFT_425906 [Gyrodon lividus]